MTHLITHAPSCCQLWLLWCWLTAACSDRQTQSWRFRYMNMRVETWMSEWLEKTTNHRHSDTLHQQSHLTLLASSDRKRHYAHYAQSQTDSVQCSRRTNTTLKKWKTQEDKATRQRTILYTNNIYKTLHVKINSAIIIHRESKKYVVITLSNIYRLSKFFHHHAYEKFAIKPSFSTLSANRFLNK